MKLGNGGRIHRMLCTCKSLSMIMEKKTLEISKIVLKGGASGKSGAPYLVLVRRSYLEWLGRNVMTA